MPPILGIPLGIVVGLVGAWLLIVLIRRLLGTPLGWVVLAVLAVAGLLATVGHVKRQGQPRDVLAVQQRVGATSSQASR